jgi:hypothetical protein
MHSEPKDQAFIFSEYFDISFLEELYDGDLPAAVEVFNSAHIQILDELGIAADYFQKGDITSVKKVYHKIKPLFGYVGLTEVQDFVHRFEESCQHAARTAQLQTAYDHINEIIGEAIIRIQQESERLKDHINQRA